MTAAARPSTRLVLRTQDRDLALTLALWLADALGLAAQPPLASELVLDDDQLLGSPFRRRTPGLPACGFVATRRQHALHLRCTSTALALPHRPVRATLRRLLVRAGLSQDPSPVTHAHVVERVAALRRAAFACGFDPPPERPARFLLRVDDFPSTHAPSADFPRFHRLLADHGIPYLLAATPFLERPGQPGRLTPAERQMLADVTRDGAELALHGFTHRSRYRNYASELVSLPPAELLRQVARARESLHAAGGDPWAFVAPFNTYDPHTLAGLAGEFALLAGGPESIQAFGPRVGPSFFLEALYVPSYRGVYDVDPAGLAALDRLAEAAAGQVLPLTLHWANGVATNFRSFHQLAARLRGRTLAWSAFRREADAVRALAATA